MRSPIDMMPAWMKTDVTVLRGGGKRDRDGVLQAGTPIEVKGCVVAPASSEDIENSNATDSEVSIYHGSFRFLSTDVVVVPDGAPMSGKWQVNGRPREYPMGVHALLKAGK